MKNKYIYHSKISERKFRYVLRLFSLDARERWKRHSELVQRSTFVKVETLQEKYVRIAKLRKDYNAFVEYYFPHWCMDKVRNSLSHAQSSI
jgi:hypothetical protein